MLTTEHFFRRPQRVFPPPTSETNSGTCKIPFSGVCERSPPLYRLLHQTAGIFRRLRTIPSPLSSFTPPVSIYKSHATLFFFSRNTYCQKYVFLPFYISLALSIASSTPGYRTIPFPLLCFTFCSLNYVSSSGAEVEYQLGMQEDVGSIPACALSSFIKSEIPPENSGGL